MFDLEMPAFRFYAPSITSMSGKSHISTTVQEDILFNCVRLS